MTSHTRPSIPWLPLVLMASTAVLLTGRCLSAEAALGKKEKAMPEQDAPPRKVVVGTLMYSMWGEYPGGGMHLTQVPTRCSVAGHGRLSPDTC